MNNINQRVGLILKPIKSLPLLRRFNKYNKETVGTYKNPVNGKELNIEDLIQERITADEVYKEYKKLEYKSLFYKEEEFETSNKLKFKAYRVIKKNEDVFPTLFFLEWVQKETATKVVQMERVSLFLPA